jgi:hypothetical protein
MTPQEFGVQFKRVENHFRMGADVDRDQVYKDWFKGLAHYHVDAVSTGIDGLIRDARDTFWPAFGLLSEAIRLRLAGMPKTTHKCATCHGSTWIEARPWKSNGRIYEGFQRCPDCGVPAPQHHVGDHREELTATEYAQWMRGEFQEPEMPVSRTKHAIGKSHGMTPFQKPSEVA